jgi:hypothetical protein
MRAVGSFIAGLTAKAYAKHGFSVAGLAGQWSAIVGGELAAYTRPEQLRWPRRRQAPGEVATVRRREGATLVLRVEGARALDVQFRTPQVLERINGYFGYAAVGTLRFLQGPVAPTALSALAGVPADYPTARTALHPVSGQLCAARWSREGSPPGLTRAPRDATGDDGGATLPELAAIADPALREALSRLHAGVQRGRRLQHAEGKGG